MWEAMAAAYASGLAGYAGQVQAAMYQAVTVPVADREATMYACGRCDVTGKSDHKPHVCWCCGQADQLAAR